MDSELVGRKMTLLMDSIVAVVDECHYALRVKYRLNSITEILFAVVVRSYSVDLNHRFVIWPFITTKQ